MKKNKYITAIVMSLLMVLFFNSCQETTYEFGDIVTPGTIEITAEIVGQDTDNPNGDGSGQVNFTAKASNAVTYKFNYNGFETLSTSGEATYYFSDLGVNTYTLTVVASGTAGVTTSTTVSVDVLALYEAPDDLKETLYDYNEGEDTSKEWRIKSEVAGHMGVGPDYETSPIWWSAPAGDKAATGMYDDRYTFNSDGTFSINTNSTNDDDPDANSGTIFGQATPLDTDFGDQGLTPNDNGEHENYPKEDYTGSWVLTAPSGQETLTLTNNGFFGFYVGGSGSYSILSRSETEMTLKTIGDDGNAWFFILTSEEPGATTVVDYTYNNLVWSDEFDTDGAVSSTNWTAETIPPNNGSWWNNEVQHYTDRLDNAYISDGTLKIVAKKEDFTIDNSTKAYTSARLISKDKYEFTYGRVEVRAKLPAGQGTWPAIWMLGANDDEVGWPQCGEIDIMEQTGDDKNTSLGTFHWYNTAGANNASYGLTTPVANVDSEFHLYTLEWTSEKLTIYLDDVSFIEFTNSTDLPFYDNDFYLILNIAMGSTLGGTIDPDFTEDVMEIDYVRVYQ